MFVQLLEFLRMPLLIFSFTVCVTPGPNNLMLAASGANFGYRRTIPHILGILVGMNLLFLCTASGLAGILMAIPSLYWVLKIGGASYLLYFAWKIAMARGPNSKETNGGGPNKPISFVTAGLFQFMNPKGFVIGLSTLSVFAAPGPAYRLSVIAIMLVFTFVCIFTTSLWAGAGSILRRQMKTASFCKAFNISLALLTAATVLVLLIP